jgi:dihydropyrimidinase
MGILLKGGKIITAVDSYYSDIRIEGEKIVSIGSNLEQPGDEIISVEGCCILPGGIDTHTHFDLDVGSTVTADDFESGTKAAIAGGTTTILDYGCQNRGSTLKSALDEQHRKSQGKCYCDYGFHMGITDWNDETSKEIEYMVKEGVTSFKMYMAYKKTMQVDDGAIYKALKRSKEAGGLITFHCENGDLIETFIEEAKRNGKTVPYYHPLSRPVEVENEAIERLIKIAEIAGVPVYVVHLSSKSGLMSILDAKKRGTEVYVETCPQYLMLNDSCYGEEDSTSFEGAKYVMSPPLRKEYDQEALWNGLAFGEIDTIGTDHCSFNFKGQKEIGINDFSKIPNGGPGVENRMGLIYTYGVLSGKLSINEMVAVTSTNAAKIFGLFPQKGTIAVGSDADLVVWDPNYSSTISAEKQIQNVDYNPYEGFKQQGRALHVLLRGNKVVFDAEVIEKVPGGKYLYRKPFSGK